MFVEDNPPLLHNDWIDYHLPLQLMSFPFSSFLHHEGSDEACESTSINLLSSKQLTAKSTPFPTKAPTLTYSYPPLSGQVVFLSPVESLMADRWICLRKDLVCPLKRGQNRKFDCRQKGCKRRSSASACRFLKLSRNICSHTGRSFSD